MQAASVQCMQPCLEKGQCTLPFSGSGISFPKTIFVQVTGEKLAGFS